MSGVCLNLTWEQGLGSGTPIWMGQAGPRGGGWWLGLGKGFVGSTLLGYLLRMFTSMRS